MNFFFFCKENCWVQMALLVIDRKYYKMMESNITKSPSENGVGKDTSQFILLVIILIPKPDIDTTGEVKRKKPCNPISIMNMGTKVLDILTNSIQYYDTSCPSYFPKTARLI